MPLTRTTIAPLAALLAAATLATSATAQPIDPRDNRQSNTARSQDLRSPDSRDSADGRGTFTAPEVTVIKLPRSAPAQHDGIDWADVAIGAGGAGGLLAISLVGAITLRRHSRAAAIS